MDELKQVSYSLRDQLKARGQWCLHCDKACLHCDCPKMTELPARLITIKEGPACRFACDAHLGAMEDV